MDYMKKVPRLIKFNQNCLAKTIYWYEYWSMKKAKNHFENNFFKLMYNAVFGKAMENVIKHRYIKLITTERRRNYLISEPHYHTKKFLTGNLLTKEMKKKTDILMNKLVYLRLSILELSKISMYEFWYDYVKLNMLKK